MSADLSRFRQRFQTGPNTITPLRRLTPERAEERDILQTQLLSLGLDLDQFPELSGGSNAELEKVLAVMVASGKALGEIDDGQEREGGDEDGHTGALVTAAAAAVTIEPQMAGSNHLMSGALPPPSHASTPSPCSSSDDATVSTDTLPALFRSMPHYMVSVAAMKTMHIFTDARIYDSFPAEFFTTVNGLKRAWDEANTAHPDEQVDLDAPLFRAVVKRGGRVENAYWSVKYPCDIVALDEEEGEEGDVEFWDEIRGMGW